MKRSEMVKIMWKFIRRVENDYDKYMDEESTSKLLTKMEKSGMLPPIEPDRTEADLDLGVPEWEEE